MKVSFKTITYGRTQLLEEAIFSFLNLYNNDSELVIVNDYPEQTLVYDHPQIKIFNLKETFQTIGEKENFAIEQCSGDIIGVFDDDDICMPWHLDNIKEWWKEDTNLLHWNRAVFYNEPEISAITGVGNSGIVYSKKVWEKIGKSPIMNAGGDTILVNSIHALGSQYIVNAAPSNEKVSWFYRWSLPASKENGGGSYHQSGQGFDVPNNPNVILRNAAHVEMQRIKGLIPTGIINLKPHWNHDYIEMLKTYNLKNK
jgi:glycosyltransferase involved in cell wall biosynthesis